MTNSIDQFVLKVVNGLAAEFSGVVARTTVLEVVLRASLDLQGQIAPEAASEMLYRLARHRLLETPAGDQRGSSDWSAGVGSSRRR